MKLVDAFLLEGGVPVHARPIRGLQAISESLGMTLPLLFDPPEPGCYTDRPLGSRIDDWFGHRYGARLYTHFGPGSSFYLLRGDPWRVSFRSADGQDALFISTSEGSSDRIEDAMAHRLPRRNILDSFHELPPGLLASLTSQEMRETMDWYRRTYNDLAALDGSKGLPLILEARSDLSAAVDHAVRLPDTHYGQSKWSSLQAAEKVLKSFLVARGRPYPHRHELVTVAELAEAAGLPPISRGVLTEIQCVADVRYGTPVLSAEEAFEAHQAAIGVCGHVARSLVDLVPES